MAIYQKAQRKPNKLIQQEAMKSAFPQFKCKRNGNELIFTGDLVIKPELPVYNISVHYRGSRKPDVYINSPSLVANAPHVYNDKSVCLFHSDNFKWRADKLVAKEIIQWTIAWIYFYEAWLETGVWYGPEVPHGDASSKPIEHDVDLTDEQEFL